MMEKLPTPDDLVPAPQLALICVLERTLEMLVRLLLAQHPHIFDHEKPCWLMPDLPGVFAEDVVSDIEALSRSLNGYRFMLSEETLENPQDDDLSPF